MVNEVFGLSVSEWTDRLWRGAMVNILLFLKMVDPLYHRKYGAPAPVKFNTASEVHRLKFNTFRSRCRLKQLVAQTVPRRSPWRRPAARCRLAERDGDQWRTCRPTIPTPRPSLPQIQQPRATLTSLAQICGSYRINGASIVFSTVRPLRKTIQTMTRAGNFHCARRCLQLMRTFILRRDWPSHITTLLKVNFFNNYNYYAFAVW